MRRSTDRQAASTELLALLLVIVLSSPMLISAADLNQQTINAWDEYIQGINSQMTHRSTGRLHFSGLTKRLEDVNAFAREKS